jgi:hypothetical protein
MKARPMRVLLVTIVAAAAAAGLLPGIAHADNRPYDGAYADGSGCMGFSTVRSATIYDTPTPAILGTVELRYSSSCRTVWTRVLAFGCRGCINPRVEGAVWRLYDNKWLECGRFGWSDSLQREYCLTPMVNDAGVVSRAFGQIWGSDGNPHYAYTGTY